MARTLVVWSPDWPLTAAGIPPQHPAIVLRADLVAVCSAAARAVGIRIGLRRREAQARCPQLTVLDADPRREARMFDPVVAAAMELVPAVEVVRPGLLALGVRGPSRVFGGEEQVAARLRETVDRATHETLREQASTGQATRGTLREDSGPATDGASRGDAVQEVPAVPGCRIGIADGRFAAMLAARHATPDIPVRTVEVGHDAAFLAPLPLAALSQGLTLMGGGGPGQRGVDPDALRELIELGRQLGIRTLGDLAALPRAAVGDRFGRTGLHAHQIARGDDDRSVVPLGDLDDCSVRIELDPPAAQVETVAFAARGPAEELVTSLARRARTCTLVVIEAETEHGELLARRWRSHDGFTPELLVDRVRWQLDGWLAGSTGQSPPTAGITLLRLVPDEIVEGAEQASLLGDPGATTPQVVRALTRVQALLGPDAVLVGAEAEGRDPASWTVTAPWGEHPVPARPAASSARPPISSSRSSATSSGSSGPSSRPWPGRLPSPAPATVLARPLLVEVVDRAGAPVGVSGRGAVSGVPDRVRVEGGPWRAVAGWAGPWPADERWWEPTGRRRARFQLADEDGLILLLSVEDGRWQVEAIYD